MRFAAILLLCLGCAKSTGSTSRRDGAVDAAARDLGRPAADLGARDGGPRDLAVPRPDSGGCAMTTCGAACVDLMTDPANCGACGRSCVVPNANAACTDGTCAIASCMAGWADCDGDEVNGCEVASDACVPGAACTTSCGSAGTASCGAGCAATCEPPAESCNLADDDCDGQCDQGGVAGCRVGVHRAYGNGSHFYSTSLAEASSAPFTLESANFFYLYATSVPGSAAFYRCRKTNGRYFYTRSSTCEGGGASEGILGHLVTEPRCGSTPLYRLFKDGSHFYTTSAGERDNAVSNLGWSYESVAGHVWTAP